MPAVRFFNALHILLGGLARSLLPSLFFHTSIGATTQTGQPPKGDTVTLTNNLERIEVLANTVLQLVDAKEYQQAHLILDMLEGRVQVVRRHIEHLQNVTDFAARPAGDEVT